MALDWYNIFSFMIGPTWLLDHFVVVVYFMFFRSKILSLSLKKCVLKC